MKRNLKVGEPIFLAACRCQKTSRTPVWFMRQAGRYMAEYRKLRERWSIKDLSKTPELATKVTMQPIHALGVDAAILFSDILLIAEPMGFKLNYAQGEGPVFSNPIRRENDIKKIKPIKAEKDLAYAGKALQMIRSQLDPAIALIGFAGAPYTLASYLIEGGSSRDYLRTKSLMYQNPKAWNSLMNKLSIATIDYLKLQIQSGAQCVQIFDSWVGSLSPQDFRTYVLPYCQKIVKQLKPLGAPIIYFGTGTSGLLDLAAQTDADVIGADWRIPLSKAWKQIGHNKAIQGNLDPAALFGPKSTIKKGVVQILNEAAGRPGHIFNLGHGILQHTPVENAKYTVDIVKNFNHSKR